MFFFFLIEYLLIKKKEALKFKDNKKIEKNKTINHKIK
jgi:hypothetical protein